MVIKARLYAGSKHGMIREICIGLSLYGWGDVEPAKEIERPERA